MELKINPELCQGHGRCYDLATACSGTTTRATGRSSATASCRRGQSSDARLAVANCPEQAIELLEEE